MKRLGMISLTAFLIVSCTGAIKKQQAFEIYTAGEYTLLEECPSERIVEGSVNISRDIVQVDHTVCDVKGWDVSEENGIKMDLHNCRSDGGDEPARQIFLTVDDDYNQILRGWSDSDRKIIKCEYQ